MGRRRGLPRSLGRLPCVVDLSRCWAWVPQPPECSISRRVVGPAGPVRAYVGPRAQPINIRPLLAAGDQRRTGRHRRRLADRAGGSCEGLPVAGPPAARTPDCGSASTWSRPGSAPRPRRCWRRRRSGRRPRGAACWSIGCARSASGPGSRAVRQRRRRRCPGLTPREIEVLQLVAAGRSNGEIGTALVHQHQDGQRARVQHLGQARRQRPRRGRRPRPPPRPRLITPDPARSARPPALASAHYGGAVKWKAAARPGCGRGRWSSRPAQDRRTAEEAELWAAATDPVDRFGD